MIHLRRWTSDQYVLRAADRQGPFSLQAACQAPVIVGRRVIVFELPF
jgi:hypothetical protein